MIRLTLQFLYRFGCPMHRSLIAMGGVDKRPAFRLHRTNEDPVIPAIRPIKPILPDGEAILQPPMDDTPNDAPAAPPVRIPHFGHALLFLSITAALLLLAQVTVMAFSHAPIVNGKPAIQPRLLLLSEVVTYLLTLAISWGIFPLLWQRSFTNGLRFNLDAARRNALKLIPIGVTLSLMVQAVSSLITQPKDIPIENFFHSRMDIWLTSALGVLLAPLFEEVAFRGFLLPAFAIAYDWLTLKHTPAAMAEWHSTNRITRAGWAFAAILTSIFFAGLHGAQIGYSWPVLLLLFAVSLVLSFVRLRLRSVLASTLLHASYNFTIFFTLFLGTDGYRHLDKLTH